MPQYSKFITVHLTNSSHYEIFAASYVITSLPGTTENKTANKTGHLKSKNSNLVQKSNCFKPKKYIQRDSQSEKISREHLPPLSSHHSINA